MKIRFEVLGNPHPQGRPRLTRKGFAYTPMNTRRAAQAFMLQAMAHKPPTPVTGPISVYLVFEMPIPKSASKKQRYSMAHNMIKHIKRPDIDNLVKFSLDCMQKCGFFLDDSQIYGLSCKKVYGENPKTIIEIEGGHINNAG